MRRQASVCIGLFLWFFSVTSAFAQPGRILHSEGPSRIAVVAATPAERLTLQRGTSVVWSATGLRFAPWGHDAPLRLNEAGLTGLAFTGWSGGDGCCWVTHVFARAATGVVHAGTFNLGRVPLAERRLQQPGDTVIRVPDAVFDAWDGSLLGRSISPAVPLRWDGHRLIPDDTAMRLTPAQALGSHACGVSTLAGPAGRFASPEAAVAALRAATWARRGVVGESVSARSEAARLVACLVYGGQARAGRDLLRAAWPSNDRAGLLATERQLVARLACSGFGDTLRAVNRSDAPFLGGRCARNGRDFSLLRD